MRLCASDQGCETFHVPTTHAGTAFASSGLSQGAVLAPFCPPKPGDTLQPPEFFGGGGSGSHWRLSSGRSIPLYFCRAGHLLATLNRFSARVAFISDGLRPSTLC